MLADRQRELAPLMHETLKLIWDRLFIPMGTDHDTLRDIQRLVDKTLAAFAGDDFKDSPL
jgi:hypothetical protein